MAYRVCGDWHEAEDLVQLVLWRLHQRWGRLANRDQLLGYAGRTLLNVYLDERRRHRWLREVSHAEVPDVGAPDQPAVDDYVMLMAQVRQLAPRQRAVIALRFWGDMTIEETAEALDCSTGTVTTHTHRALTTLRGALSEEGLTREAGTQPAQRPGRALIDV